MRIGIDVSQVVYKGSGVSRFTEGLIDAICDFGTEHDWVFFFSSLRKSLDAEIKNKIISKNFKLVQFFAPPIALSFLWNTVHLLNIESFVGELDWFISSDWTQPPAKNKKATVVHDLVYLRYPQTVDPQIRQTQKKRLKWVKKESDIIFADSQTTAQDLVELLSIDREKIQVIYPGVEVTKPSPSEIQRCLRKFNLKHPFILTVGKLEPRKNLPRLIDAFGMIDQENTELVVVGPKGWGPELNQTKKVRLLGFVSDSDLAALYSACLFFIYPSLWEGFGYPIVEAMKLGAAVATSNTSSLAEIGQDAALLFDPLNTKEVKSTMQKMIEDKKLREALSRKGKEKSKQFNWKTYYEKMIQTLINQKQ